MNDEQILKHLLTQLPQPLRPDELQWIVNTKWIQILSERSPRLLFDRLAVRQSRV